MDCSWPVRVCPHCDQQFHGSVVKYNQHLKTHRVPISCARCGFTSDIATAFIEHCCNTPTKKEIVNDFTFQQHVRDHALNDQAWINCRYCSELSTSTSRSIVRENVGREIEQAKKNLEKKRRNQMQVSAFTLQTLVVHKPPFLPVKIEAKQLSRYSSTEMKPCQVSPPKSTMLESGRMNH